MLQITNYSLNYSINFQRWIKIAVVRNLTCSCQCYLKRISPIEQSCQILLAREHLALKSRAGHDRLRRMKSFVIVEMKNSKRDSCRAMQNFFSIAYLWAESAKLGGHWETSPRKNSVIAMDLSAVCRFNEGSRRRTIEISSRAYKERMLPCIMSWPVKIAISLSRRVLRR